MFLAIRAVSSNYSLAGAKVAQSFARCSLFGYDHIQTFDESLYDFAGDCSYLLAGDCDKKSFSLVGESQLANKYAAIGFNVIVAVIITDFLVCEPVWSSVFIALPRSAF